MRLLDFATNVHSQYGEDGILSKTLELIPTKDKWCVEFGAWDGEYLSNTRNLVQRCGYSSVLIEADEKKFINLKKRYAADKNIIPLKQFVGFQPHDNLDVILSGTPVPKDFDVLSIDIDGNDYHVWKAMSQFTPKVICIEFNPTIPTEVEYVQAADPKLNQSTSLSALVKLGKQKEYELVCVTHNNAIFVRSCYFPLFGIQNNDPRILREDLSGLTYLFCGLDGTLLMAGRDFLPHHHGIRISRRIRQLPKIFRHYPYNFGSLTEISYKFYWRVAKWLGRA